jgi:Family of unknown function (DUF5996)
MRTLQSIRYDGPLWPEIEVSLWGGTKRSLHMYSQMLGKIKLAAAPMQPNWMFTALLLTPRGFTTGFLPWRGESFEVTLDVFDSTIAIDRSNGAREAVRLLPVRTIAEIYAELSAALATLEIDVPISTTPQEVPDTTPFDQDRRPAQYDPAAVVRWFAAATATWGVFDAWRARFFGRDAIALWWGAFDIGLMLFSGKHAPAPTDRGYLFKYDLDAEMMNVGLYFGDAQNAPFFYGYIYPEPNGCETLEIGPDAATWSGQLREWVLPYAEVRSAADPAALVHTFIDAIYEQTFAAAGWERGAYSYSAPKPKGHR